MILSSSYIKVKSRTKLRQEINQSERKIGQAGSNDEDNQPGATSLFTPIRNLTGVPMPGAYQVGVPFGEVLTTRSSGMGKGNVGMPPAQPSLPLTTDMIYGNLQYEKWRDKLRSTDPDLIISYAAHSSTVENMPSQVFGPGSMYKELERTTGQDPARVDRTRRRWKEILSKEGNR